MSDAYRKTIDTALQSLALDGALTIRVAGECMVPLLEDGAMVSVRKQKRYWPGDVLIKRESDGRLVAHRLLGCYRKGGETRFVTRADNISKADAAVKGAMIIGRVSGGDCAEVVISVPALSRLRAMGQFVVLGVQRLVHRLP